MQFLFHFALGWLYGHLFEYLAHRFILHNHKLWLRFFQAHFSEHHKLTRRHGMIDPKYLMGLSRNLREVLILSSIAIIHLPVFFVSVAGYIAILYSLVAYYTIHGLSHSVYGFGRRWVPWHYDHHLGKNPNRNWGVRLPVFDWIFRTRVFFRATHDEAKWILRTRKKKR